MTYMHACVVCVHSVLTSWGVWPALINIHVAFVSLMNGHMMCVVCCINMEVA